MKVILQDGTVQECSFDDEVGREAFRHTTSHIMAQAIKRLYPTTKCAIGPAIKDGFYYDFEFDFDFTDDNLAAIEAEMKKIVKENLKLTHFTMEREEALKTLPDADVVLWLVEPTTFIGAGEKQIIELLKTSKTPVILVINKVDTVKRDEILLFMDTYRKEMDFAEIVPVSALKGDNIDTLIECITKYLPYGPAFYDEDTVTDQPERQIVAELIREKALKCLSEEIPHGIAVSIESMKYRKNIADIEATIFCEKDSHKGIIIGKQGAMLKKIGSMARRDIEDLIECKANLQLWVKVKKDWRDSDFMLKNFGYRQEDLKE